MCWFTGEYFLYSAQLDWQEVAHSFVLSNEITKIQQ